MMKNVTVMFALMLFAGTSAFAQQSEFLLNVPASTDTEAAYTAGINSGARGISGPYDLDGDGNFEVLLTDYTGGGRVHVIENKGADTWELVYTTPWLDSTASVLNARYAIGADMDGDAFGEIIFLSGRGFSETNPNIADLPAGLYVFENIGDDDYGAAPATIYEFGDDLPDRWVSEQMDVFDFDGDGIEELLLPNNGSDNRYDNWYALSVTGDIGSGFDVWTQEFRLSSRSTEDFDPVGRGGGSPYAIHGADLNGDGAFEISMHSWNQFNFTNGTITGADTYEFPAASDLNINLQASSTDDYSIFGGTVVDIDGDGNDEIFYPNVITNNVSLLNYNTDEDVLQVTTDNLVFELLEGLTGLGITSGDLDGDGSPELIASGTAYTASSFNAGNSPAWVHVVEFNGGDPEDPLNYTVATPLNYQESFDMDEAQFNTVNRDSAGVTSTYLESGPNGALFVSKLAYLGDPDNDGINEVALGFQGINDATIVYDEVYNADSTRFERTISSSVETTNRIFMRVLSGTGLQVSIDDERIVLPNDYRLDQNYPNPFNPTTTIRFSLPIDKAISVRVYDVTGRLVKTLVNDQTFAQGVHEVIWDGTSQAGNQVASGTYIYSLEYGNFRQSKSMVLIK